MELTRVRRLGKIVLRGFTKAFVLDSEPGQQFTLRQETIDHPLYNALGTRAAGDNANL